MLSRTAEHLFWMGRYIERADATARLVEMGRRMAMLPGASGEWRSVARASGAAGELGDDPKATADAIILRLLIEGENRSSIRSCMVQARANGRAIRTAITQDMWEALNDNWRKLESVTASQALTDLPSLLDWVRQRSAAFRGATETGLLRNDGFIFLRLGELIERTEMTLRLLDVKYYVLLPETDVVGGGRDFHQWTAVLRALSAQRAYHHVYRGDYTPWGIAEFLILNKIFPRSANFCYRSISAALDELAMDYGERHDCHDIADQMVERLSETDIQTLFQSGLHEFITNAVRTTNRLASEIAKAYYF
ncbi:MAG: alpha-E domain-containing protein [Hyphomonadaceae bacterium]|nr:alpha-E domain-containing protein [Hyphomonadaceae bacterium]